MPAAATAPTANTAYSIQVTITTNSNPGNLVVSNISGQCLAQDGTTVLRTFSGQGNGASAREIFGEVITNCPVTFLWAEQQPGTNITCTGFTLTVSNPNNNTQASPFPSTSFSTPTTFSISPGGTLLATSVANGDADWTYAGSITTKVGTNTARTAAYDPEVDVGDLE
jgi:hypothetical protein